VTELDFNAGNRHVGQLDQPCILAPVYGRASGDNPPRMGLVYIENGQRNLEEADMCFLAALGQLISPFIINLIAETASEDARHLSEAKGDSIADIASRDHQVKIVFSTAAHVSQGQEPIFITGEVGTGKASLARHIHQQSPYKAGPFAQVTLSELPPAQMDRILFGQEGGSDNHMGLISLADNGTIFLRHIEYLTMNAQRSILMALEEGLIYPIGSRHSRTVQVRFLSSSSANLSAMVEAGTFREDLHARLTRINLAIPPLRETRGDIESLAGLDLSKAFKNLGKPFKGLDLSALECLRAYPWPGNLSELRTECSLLAHFSRNGHVSMEILPAHLRLAPEVFSRGEIEADSVLGEAERFFLSRALSIKSGDVEAAASVLSISPEEVIIKSRAYGLDPMDFQEGPGPGTGRSPGQTNLPSSEA
jgi:DNA-binding NtrC family response regulator